MISPIEQLKSHFLGDRDFTSNFVKFVGDTIKRFNNEYLSNEPVQFVINALHYNVKHHTYTVKIYKLDASTGAKGAADDLANGMIGITHPIYCVGYVISADGWVSTENFNEKETREQIVTDLRNGKTPPELEMIIHTVVSITDIRRMNLYEVVRESGEIRNSGIRDVNSTLKSALTNLFSAAHRAFMQTYDDLSLEERKSVRTNIFE